ncbi:uncharacterized protein LOC118437722 [Folsomia candida]|uniref:uncharacterized protein LOC118437722 n=1 Tax=Folsomia candida TaxID=158441 RepID=UPI001604CA7A|nr:uncharacterized protein LOC118437722 [Folsomia candida]XP_035712924.1 uncharacterized protein LOC118437722 [Folsomia candida]
MMNNIITETGPFPDSNNNKGGVMLPSSDDDTPEEKLETKKSFISIGPSGSGEGPNEIELVKSRLKSSGGGKQVEFAPPPVATPSLSQEKIRRSGSMFVRISDTTVDQERMDEFEKLEADEKISGLPPPDIKFKKDDLDLGHAVEEVERSSPIPPQVEKPQFIPPPPTGPAPSLPTTTTATRKTRNNDAPKKEGPTNTPKNSAPNPPRPKSATRSRHLLTVEVLGRKVAPVRDKSPYACKIIEIPDQQQAKFRTNKKVWVCQKDHKLLEDQLQGHEKQKTEDNDNGAGQVEIVNWLVADPLENKDNLMTESMPLAAWPNFHTNSQKSTETQTSNSAPTSDLESTSSKSHLTLPFSQILSVDLTPTPGGTSTFEANSIVQVADYALLAEMADKVEAGIFRASETCSVLINMVFKDSLGNPASLERVMESQDFNDFLKSPNEITALERGAVVLGACGRVIKEYLEAVKASSARNGEAESNTNFARRSSEIVSVTGAKKKNVTLAALQKKYTSSDATIWSFVPPLSPDKFQLALFLNPETGEVMQTVTCQEHIFRTRYTTSPLESQIRNLISSSREQVGLPAFVKPEYLLDTIVRCSSCAVARLTKANTLLAQCNAKLTEYLQAIAKPKFAVSMAKLGKLDGIRRNIQQLNITAGIVYQMSMEMSNACKSVQNGVWNSMYVQDVLRFPRIPGFPNPKSNRECQIPAFVKIPVQEAMKQLKEGLQSIDYAVRLGQFSLETLRFGVKLEKEHKKLVKDYLEGVRTLGSENDVDYGSLLMTILCSTEMLLHFEDVMPSVDKFVRSAILTHLGKINWGTAEVLGIVKRMETDAHILSMRTTFKLRELKNRYRQEYGGNI